MASAGKSRRSRSRKPRPDSSGATPRPESRAPAPGPKPKAPQPGSKPKAPAPAITLGERPRPPWHPLPLSELLILVGALGTVIGLGRGVSHGTTPLVAGLVAVGLGTFEVTLREHWSGYRSHAILLALLPVLVFHTLVVVGASAFAHPSQLLSILLLPVDLALYVFLFKLLRARFLDARQLRALGRR